ncbi:MAG: hypothetical protein WA001_02770 [Patescibacteria group bacterium]
MTDLSLQHAPFDDGMNEEEPDDEITAAGMRVVEGDESVDDDDVKVAVVLEDDEDDEKEPGADADAAKDPDEDKDDDEPKDGLAELEELAAKIDEDPVDMGIDE